MSTQHPVNDDEIILKRILPGKDNIKPKGSSTVRATSFGIKPRPSEEYPSWSRQRYTLASELLDLEAKKHDVSGWTVAAVTVAAVRRLGLDVVSDPTEEDPGHCLIVPTSEQGFTATIWSTLAKETKIVYTGRDESGQTPG